MKVAIVYDRVNKFGGAERVLLTLHEIFPNAPLYTSVYEEKNAKWAEVFPEIKTSFLQNISFAKNNHEFFAPLMPLVFSLFNFDKYDLVISVTSEFAKNINVKNNHICYCLTPTRYLWSHENQYISGLVTSKLARPIINYLKKIDYKAAQKPDMMIAISTVVQKRIKKYYNRDSQIIFPPASRRLSASRGGPVNIKNYFLVVSRLVKYKKVDLAIKAFNDLGLPLLIIGTGREEKKLKKIANKQSLSLRDKTIFFKGFVKEKDLSKYYSNALALIFPQDEDFGITAVEAQNFGLPVIAYKAGGALDTVIPSKTGVFFDKQDKQGLINAIKKFKKLKFNKKIIIKNASKFSKARFKENFLHLVKTL